MSEEANRMSTPQYEALDRVLRFLEKILVSFISQFGLEQASVERWRWDEPVTTLRWIGSDQISRNIHAAASLIDSTKSQVQVDTNAWIDVFTEGRNVIRRWRNIGVGQLELSSDLGNEDRSKAHQMLVNGFKSVAEVGYDQLEKRSFIR